MVFVCGVVFRCIGLGSPPFLPVICIIVYLPCLVMSLAFSSRISAGLAPV